MRGMHLFIGEAFRGRETQDIRDMVAKQRADQQLMQKMKWLVESPEILKEDYDLITELSKDKARRLGLDPDSAKS